MIISIDTVKAFDKYQHLFVIKTSDKLEIKGTSTSITIKKPTATIIFNDEKPVLLP